MTTDHRNSQQRLHYLKSLVKQVKKFKIKVNGNLVIIPQAPSILICPSLGSTGPITKHEAATTGTSREEYAVYACIL